VAAVAVVVMHRGDQVDLVVVETVVMHLPEDLELLGKETMVALELAPQTMPVVVEVVLAQPAPQRRIKIQVEMAETAACRQFPVHL